MATIVRRDIDNLESWESLAQLESNLEALVVYVRARKDQARAKVYGQPNPDHARLVADAALAVPAAITF